KYGYIRVSTKEQNIDRQLTAILKEKNADIVVLDFPLLDTRNQINNLTGKFLSDIVLQILSYLEKNFFKKALDFY
ncbi:MAG: hypothetical protein SPK45_00230, partial [Anaerovoracaceae bacterium]|nr:hypothetical protein [Anaerovoracaceae bacterium]